MKNKSPKTIGNQINFKGPNKKIKKLKDQSVKISRRKKRNRIKNKNMIILTIYSKKKLRTLSYL
jgi:hypothetical protein